MFHKNYMIIGTGEVGRGIAEVGEPEIKVVIDSHVGGFVDIKSV